MVPLRKHWESTSVIGCSVFVVNHDWLQLQLQSKMAEVLTQSGPQVVFHTPRNIKVASCLILIVTIHECRVRALNGITLFFHPYTDLKSPQLKNLGFLTK